MKNVLMRISVAKKKKLFLDSQYEFGRGVCGNPTTREL